jgi:hypothetical protein
MWNLLEQEKMAELKYIYCILSRVSEGIKAMLEGFSCYLRSKGMFYINELNAMTLRGSHDQFTYLQVRF